MSFDINKNLFITTNQIITSSLEMFLLSYRGLIISIYRIFLTFFSVDKVKKVSQITCTASTTGYFS